VSLRPHRTFDGRIGGGETRSYQIELKAGQYLEAVVDQKGVDVAVRIIDPAGKKLLEIDSPNGPQGPESVYFIAPTAGLYRLEVAAGDRALPGAYQVRVLRLAKPSGKERLRAEADQVYSEAASVSGKAMQEAYEKAAGLAAGAELPRLEIYALEMAATTAANSRDVPSAVALYERAADRAQKAKDWKSAGEALDAIGLLYRDSLPEQALSHLEKALGFQRKSKDLQGESSTLNYMGNAYHFLGQSEKAIQYFQQALVLVRKIKDRQGEGVTLSNLGAAHRDLGQSEKALEFYDQALAAAREVKDRRQEAVTLQNIGLANRSLGRFEKAIESYQQALSIVHEIKDRQGEGVALGNIGLAYSYLGQYDEGMEYDQKSLAIKREVKDRRGEGITLNNIGLIYLALYQDEKALDYLQQALIIKRAVKDRRGEGITVNNIALAYKDLGQDDKALQYYEQALAIRHETKDREGEGLTLNNMAWSYYDRHQYDKSIDFAERSLAIRRQIKDHPGEGWNLACIGSAFFGLNQSEKALDYLYPALAIAREVKDRQAELLMLAMLGRAWQKLDRPRLAIFYEKQAVNLIQSVRNDIRSFDKASQESYLKWREPVYRDLADLLIAQGRLPEAQQVLDLLKEEEYFQFIRRDQAEISTLSGRADLTSDEADWAKRYREVADHLTALSVRYEELSRLKNRTGEQESERQRLDADLRAGGQAFQQFLSSLNDHFSAKVASSHGLGLDELRDAENLEQTLGQLGHGAVAIYTLVGEEKYRAILVTPTVQRAYEFPIKADELNRKIQAFREAIQDPKIDPRPAAEELHHILIVPALAEDLRQAKAETLMWYLDGTLRYVPLAALYDGKQYLVERYRLSVFTPASKARLTEVPAVDRWRLLGLGVTKGHEDFPALPNVASELHGIVRDQIDRALIDESFTPASMRTELDQGYPLVHLATHFRFRPGNEAQSFLLLGDGSHLSVAEVKGITKLFTGVDLLTLSACNTGVGDSGGDGSEVEGFGVIAQRKGAKAVIATLWSVADESTSIFMTQLYHRLESTPEISKSEALRQAQLALLHGEAMPPARPSDGHGLDYRHPYYWAPFFLMGNWL
jgi:CHAT domain-containing protein/tetratricopeptide (TPR) repeat protein